MTQQSQCVRSHWLFFVATLASCGPASGDHWYDNLQPDSPCYAVDLNDGLDESSPDELFNTFDCLNLHGHLEPLGPTVDSLKFPLHGGKLGSQQISEWVNAGLSSAPDAEISGLLDSVLEWVQDDEAGRQVQDIGLELIYGKAAVLARRPEHDPSTTALGLVTPLGEILPRVAASLDGTDNPAIDVFEDILREPDTKRWARTVDAWIISEDPTIAEAARRMLPELGDAIVRAHSPENDRWSRSTGDSLKDALQPAVSGNLLSRAQDPLDRMLGDSRIQRDLPPRILAWHRDGHLHPTLEQATFLTQVDPQGGSLQSGEDSALIALLRLLHASNGPLDCRINVGFGAVTVRADNLAVAFLDVIADQDPDNVQSAAAITGQALGGVGLSDSILNGIADSGVCPIITPQLAEDLKSIERLGQPQTRGMTHVLVGLVQAMRDGEENRIGDLVDVISIAHEADLMYAIEELLRDIGPSPFARRIADLVPALVEPVENGVIPREGDPATMSDFLFLLHAAVKPGDRGKSVLDHLLPTLTEATRPDRAWTMMRALGEVLQTPQSELSRAQEWIPAILDADPDLASLDTAADGLADDAVITEVLNLAQTPHLIGNIFTDTPVESQEQTPVAFGGQLILGGAVDDLLLLMRAVLLDLDGDSADDG